MKLVTIDYGCGTSASVLDYGIQDVILVSKDDYEHVFEADDDLFFMGHDFLYFLWDNQDKVDRWKNYKYNKLVWCFERIDAIVHQWQEKSHACMEMVKQFADHIYACDEDDCDKYGYDWFPQWGSCRFFHLRETPVLWNQILFSGQAGKPEYQFRNEFIQQAIEDQDLSNRMRISNTSRNLDWGSYIDNLLSHSAILNPVGILKGFNTRTYEVMYSGRILLQHTYGDYKRHSELLNNHPNAVMFSTVSELKDKISSATKGNPSEFFENNSLYARFKNIGVELK